MNDHVTKFIELFDKSGILKPVFLTAFFNEVIFKKPENFAAVIKCAEKANEYTETPLARDVRRLELVK